ncbi:MAG TPA: hypothetical protein VN648_33940, partial [Candidatus Methylomirabilis sp.]|nr:hypothetical protein [Candidatus Methylomirabilis sp.]
RQFLIHAFRSPHPPMMALNESGQYSQFPWSGQERDGRSFTNFVAFGTFPNATKLVHKTFALNNL